MSPLYRAAFLGLALGLRHALDADHVVAVSTLVSRTRTIAAATRLGLVWGLGHTVTILAVGGTMVLLGVHVPPGLTTAADLLVALMLVGLGAQSLRAERSGRVQPHPGPERRRPASGWLRAFCVGTVHGAAGSAGVALLALGTVQRRGTAAAYLLVFSVGIVAGMALLTAAVSLVLGWSASCGDALGRHLRRAVAVLSVLLGLALAVEVVAPRLEPASRRAATQRAGCRDGADARAGGDPACAPARRWALVGRPPLVYGSSNSHVLR